MGYVVTSNLTREGLVAYLRLEAGNREFVRKHPSATKRALRAICDWGRIHMERIGAVATLPDKAAVPSADGQKK